MYLIYGPKYWFQALLHVRQALFYTFLIYFSNYLWKFLGIFNQEHSEVFLFVKEGLILKIIIFA